jgi:transcription termination factor Rho
MSVISRSALESSSLADLHEIASELGLDGFRRLRKADLVGAIIERQGGEEAGDAESNGAVANGAVDTSDAPEGSEEEGGARPQRRSRRGGRGRSRARNADPGDSSDDSSDRSDSDERPAPRPRRSRSDSEDRNGSEDRPSRSRRGGRGDDRAERERGDRSERSDGGEERTASGTVELLPNGSGFLRVAPPEPSDDDVYISAAQVRRCELVSGDEVTGPVRLPRRSERYPSLIRIDTINGRSADEVAEGTKYDDLPCAYATDRLAFDADDDPTLKSIEWLTPLGRGSRVAIVGGPRAGKTEALRRMAIALAKQEDLECSVVLAGVRPEEIGDWKDGAPEPVAALGLGVAADALGQAIERAIETGRRVAARGGHAVVLIDSLEQVATPVARRALAAARNIVDGGSLTIVATAREPLGGETTVIALDAELASTGRIPALDLGASGTVRPELLVGEKGAEAIAEARAAALAG